MNLGHYFPGLSFDRIHDVRYLEDMSCHRCFYRQELPYMVKVSTLWPAQKSRRLAREIVDVMFSQLSGKTPRGQRWDVTKTRWLAPDVDIAGFCKKSQLDQVYIQANKIWHPLTWSARCCMSWDTW